MTGFGRGSAGTEKGAITVEVKSVNNRFLKVSTRLPDLFNELESEVEARIRGALARGTVYCNVSMERQRRDGSYRLNEQAIRDWLPRLASLAAELKTEPPALRDILAMDGVVLEETEKLEVDESLKRALFTALDSALEGPVEMRRREGESLQRDME